MTEVACWAHARSRSFDAQDRDSRWAAEMLALMGELYAIEREAKDWLDAESEVVLPRGPLRPAIGYSQKHLRHCHRLDGPTAGRYFNV